MVRYIFELLRVEEAVAVDVCLLVHLCTPKSMSEQRNWETAGFTNQIGLNGVLRISCTHDTADR
jgi:hypothetical protein